MTLEITVGPPKLAINQGHSVLITIQMDRFLGRPIRVSTHSIRD
jgi:hypothetical protein